MAGHGGNSRKSNKFRPKFYHSATLPKARNENPDIGAFIPWAAAIIAENRLHGEAGALEAACHLLHRQRSKGEIELPDALVTAATLDISLGEGREPPTPVLTDRFDEREMT